jgi:hypothetical protein
MCQPKEPCHFVNPNHLRRLWPWMWDQGYWRSRERYLSLFQSAGTARIIGEASVYYTHFPLASGVPERIRQFNPDARFIYLMRDPIERTISHYWHRVTYHEEGRSLLDAIKNDHRYSDVSYYAMQLAPYFKLFAADQIKTLTFEQLITNTDEAVGSIFRWLGLNDSITTAAFPPQNVTPEIIAAPIWNGALQRLRHQNPLLRVAVGTIPTSIRRPVRQALRRRVNPLDVDATEVAQYLRPRQRSETEELARLIGREFPEWTTLRPPRTNLNRHSCGSPIGSW